MDMLDNSKYTESHIDGLQIHYNPFAETPFGNKTPNEVYFKYINNLEFKNQSLLIVS